MDKYITFPHIGNYYIPIKYLIEKTTKQSVIVPPKITKKTIEIGSKYSPDYVCVPFKYNLGNFIESINKGANVILQAGGGCRYGYYAELQEQILKDMGYEIDFVNFIENNHVSIMKIYKFIKSINKRINFISYSYHLLITFLMIIIMDKLDKNVRENQGFEIIENSFKKIQNNFYSELNNKPSIIKLCYIYIKYRHKYKKCPVNKPKEQLRVAIVGELYSIMEPFSSCYIEEKLSRKGIEVKRFTTVTYLLLLKKHNLKKILRYGKNLLKYHLGADATESVILTEKLSIEGFDGIVHIKSFGCTPEINAMPILSNISNKNKIPILYFSFDSQDNGVGLDTRIEAFYDMINSKKNNINNKM